MSKNQTMKILQIVSLSITAICILIAVIFCIIHISWTIKGTKVTANCYYDEETSTYYISYIAENRGYQYVPLSTKHEKFIEDNKIVIYYNNNDVKDYYCVRSINKVFYVAGGGFVFLIGTIVLSVFSYKRPRIKEENEDSFDDIQPTLVSQETIEKNKVD